MTLISYFVVVMPLYSCPLEFQITVPFKYEWLDPMFKEMATFIFFIVTGYKFRPASDNPYLQVPQDSDEEIEMEEV